MPKLAGQALEIADAVDGLALEETFEAAIASAGAGSAGSAAAATETLASSLESLVTQVQTGPGQPCDDVCLMLTEAQMQNALDQMANAKRPRPGGGPGGTRPGGSGYLAGGSGIANAGGGLPPGVLPGGLPAGRSSSASAALAGVHAALADTSADAAGRGPGRGEGEADGLLLSGDVSAESIDVGAARVPAGAATARTLGVAPRYRRDAAAYFERLADEASADPLAPPGASTP